MAGRRACDWFEGGRSSIFSAPSFQRATKLSGPLVSMIKNCLHMKVGYHSCFYFGGASIQKSRGNARLIKNIFSLKRLPFDARR